MRALILLALPSLAFAHFQLVYPTPRGYDEDTLGQYPCGGQSSPSAQRTPFSLTSANPIQLDLEHTANSIQVVVALGNSPSGSDFVYTLVPTFEEMGPGDFCVGTAGNVSVPSDWGVTAGMNGTVLAITNDPEAGGGFYNCADVTFTTDMISSSNYDMHCDQAPQVETRPGVSGTNANGTSATGTDSAEPQSTTGAAMALAPRLGFAAVVGAIGFAAL